MHAGNVQHFIIVPIFGWNHNMLIPNNTSDVYASTISEDYSFVKKWGSHGDADDQFEEPTGIGIDASNNVYVSETDFENCCNLVHHRVIKFTIDGAFITKWGGNLQFENPMVIALDSIENVSCRSGPSVSKKVH